MARTLTNAFIIALLGWLPTITHEGLLVVAYRLTDLLGISPRPSFVECQWRFLFAHAGETLCGRDNLVMPLMHNPRVYTTSFRLYWWRNLDSFIRYVEGEPVVPDAPVVSQRDTSLRVMRAYKGTHWRGEHSQWAITQAQPLAVALPTGVPAEIPIPRQPRVAALQGEGMRSRMPPDLAFNAPPCELLQVAEKVLRGNAFERFNSYLTLYP